MTIHIEISKSKYKEETWNLRIGDIDGASEYLNVDFEDIIDEIKDEMLEEKVGEDER